MSVDRGPGTASAAASTSLRVKLNPYLHFGGERFYNPLTDRMLEREQSGFREVLALYSHERDLDAIPEPVALLLERDGWLVPRDEDGRDAFLLKYVSLEAHTVCNQACYFCPVSVDPRQDYFMPTELYERILGELAAYSDTIEALFMINYNEPTLDKRFVDQVKAILASGLPPAVLTNGSGLTPERVDAILAAGQLRYLSINLSTLDRDRYRRDRGKDQLPVVLRNLDYLRDKPLAETMEVVVLGTGDESHEHDFEAIRERLADTLFTVKKYEVMDRAGYLEIGLKVSKRQRTLGGCENTGSRPLQHLHITPRGECVFCCEDYDEKYVVGDLSRQSVEEVLRGPELARLRRWAYGLEESSADFICRGCIYSLTRSEG